jgi:hypothetical protein
MSRHALVLSLALVQTTTLLAGTAAALTGFGVPAASYTQAESQPVERVLHPTAPAAHLITAQSVRKPALAHRPAPRTQHSSRHAVVRRTRHAVPAPRHAVSYAERVRRAVSRIPGYRTGDAVWSITPSFGHWGVADLYSGVVYLSPRVPADRVYDVVAHEWSHLLSVKAYDGDVSGALDAMNGYFGGSGLAGAERAADCMARELGATWTHYTPCNNSQWRAGARRLLAHERL